MGCYSENRQIKPGKLSRFLFYQFCRSRYLQQYVEREQTCVAIHFDRIPWPFLKHEELLKNLFRIQNIAQKLSFDPPGHSSVLKPAPELLRKDQR